MLLLWKTKWIQSLDITLDLAPYHENYMFFQLKVRLNICISLTGMSHQIAIVNHGRVIFLDQSKASHFFHKKKFTKCETFQ